MAIHFDMKSSSGYVDVASLRTDANAKISTKLFARFPVNINIIMP